MGKDPAFLFYSSDFLTGTMLMSNEQTGKYIRLLCLQHQKGGRLSRKDMIGICGTQDEDIFDKFEVDEAGLYYNARLEAEMRRRSAYSESRRQNRLSKPQEGEPSQSYVRHMETEAETETEEKAKPKKAVLDFGQYSLPQKVIDALMEWRDMRKGMKIPTSQRSLTLNVNELRKLSGGSAENMVAIVNQSIANGWRGMFPLKGANGGSQYNPKNMGNFRQREYSDEDIDSLYTDVSGLSEKEESK